MIPKDAPAPFNACNSRVSNEKRGHVGSRIRRRGRGSDRCSLEQWCHLRGQLQLLLRDLMRRRIVWTMVQDLQ